VLMQANKNGFYYVIDRLTGQFISGQPFVHVNWAKGLDEKTGRPFVNKEAVYGADVVSISPGPGGAHNWAPMSFNPATGLVYLPASTASSFNFATETDFVYKPGENNFGVRLGKPRPDGGPGAPPPPTAPAPPMTGPDPIPGQRAVLIAYDPVTQKQRWAVPGGGGIGGGTVTTSGNLVFQVVPDGRLMAYSANKGEKLLEIQTGLRGGMAPPITYMIDGKQYVTVAGGAGLVVARTAEPGAPPPSPTANTIFPKMLTFVLDGTPMPTPAPAEASAAPAAR